MTSLGNLARLTFIHLDGTTEDFTDEAEEWAMPDPVEAAANRVKKHLAQRRKGRARPAEREQPENRP